MARAYIDGEFVELTAEQIGSPSFEKFFTVFKFSHYIRLLDIAD